VIQSILGKIFKKITRIFDWIAEGQTAGALCKGWVTGKTDARRASAKRT